MMHDRNDSEPITDEHIRMAREIAKHVVDSSHRPEHAWLATAICWAICDHRDNEEHHEDRPYWQAVWRVAAVTHGRVNGHSSLRVWNDNLDALVEEDPPWIV